MRRLDQIVMYANASGVDAFVDERRRCAVVLVPNAARTYNQAYDVRNPHELFDVLEQRELELRRCCALHAKEIGGTYEI